MTCGDLSWARDAGMLATQVQPSLLNALKEQQLMHEKRLEQLLDSHKKELASEVSSILDKRLAGVSAAQPAELAGTESTGPGTATTSEPGRNRRRSFWSRISGTDPLKSQQQPLTEPDKPASPAKENGAGPGGRTGSVLTYATTMNGDSNGSVLAYMGQQLNGVPDTVAACRAMRKLNRGDENHIMLGDIHELFNELGCSVDGEPKLPVAQWQQLMTKYLDPPCPLGDAVLLSGFIDQNDDGFVEPEEMLSSLQTGPVAAFIQGLRKKKAHKDNFAERMGYNAPVLRDFLVERLEWRVGRDDAFRTLPFSLIYATIFLLLVSFHLNIAGRHRTEFGMEEFIKGYGKEWYGPFLEDHVDNVPQAWDWLEYSGLGVVFGDCHNTSSQEEVCLVATHNILLGDVRLSLDDQSHWLLHSPEARDHLKANPGDFLNAAKARLSKLRFHSPDNIPRLITLSFMTFQESSKQLSSTAISIDMDASGMATKIVLTKSVPLVPYDGTGLVVLDVIYLLFLFRMAFGEFRDVCRAVKNEGIIEGLKDYSGFWNMCDWYSIIVGTLNTLSWCLAAIAMLDVRMDVLTGVGGLMRLDVPTIEEMEAMHGNILYLLSFLSMTFATNLFSITLKFFKAFQSNPRLHVVTNTLQRASSDIFHFCIVFIVVFVVFASIGHILFGEDRLEFSTLGQAVNTCFSTLFGEFDWYVEATSYDADRKRRSNVPVWIVIVWFILFQMFVLMVLMNMLLAIVLDHYTELMSNIQNAKTDWAKRPLWSQTWNYVQRERQTHGFVPLSEIIFRLKDDHKPAHAAPRVTEDSLLSAFPDMKPEQAAYLMNWVQHEASSMLKTEEDDDEGIARMKLLEGMMDTLTEEMFRLGLKCDACFAQMAIGDDGGVK
eukprot:TRINITY_DN37615_c0_g1_i1.p1 TRINITY_DN37615_c0_g1~~TRINITY_DN37615_c0_g1_i1.p1  ORF type:complete len:884 (-),score=146.04 TRINITY_DN37615_c0_g1_i1:205-2856(-)